MKNKREAFSLIEMLVVIAIICALAAIVFKVVGMVNERTAMAQTSNRLEHVKTCLEAYYNAYGEYPSANGVRWEKPGGSYATPEDWDDIVNAAEGVGGWDEIERARKENWEQLYPFIYEDENKYKWSEYANQAGGGFAGIKEHDIADTETEFGVDYGSIYWTNSVYSIRDAWGHDFYYRSAPPYQSFVIYSIGPDGVTNSVDDVGRDSRAE